MAEHRPHIHPLGLLTPPPLLLFQLLYALEMRNGPDVTLAEPELLVQQGSGCV